MKDILSNQDYADQYIETVLTFYNDLDTLNLSTKKKMEKKLLALEAFRKGIFKMTSDIKKGVENG